ncbi:MAG: N-6 DNA methylase [Methylovulum sp.]|nr:N-6 DNA methylase [Methylovulum sp.]
MTLTLNELLKDSSYKLSQFSPPQIQALENSITVKDTRGKATPYVTCLVRNKDIKLTPEEAVRQLYLQVLLQNLGYPVTRLAVEYGVTFGRETKRADICVFDKDRPTVPYILVELKKPKLKDGKEQLKSYCNATGAPIAVWTNGDQISYYQRKDPNYFEDIPALPKAIEKLSDILSERWTISDLIKHDKLVNEKKSLKGLILEMEDEVLANAGVDVFEELFKLIFTKLYDEMEGGRDKKRHLVFRNYGDTETELKTKIQDLFDKARNKWEGVFTDDAKLQLTPSHLAVCVASLEGVKLFNSNLDVVDEAFEYLINKSSKGEKGQYFTPRYVIDMCVKMLNPQAHETLIDTAAGSCGFPVHGIFHVWEQIMKAEGLNKSHLFTLEQKPARCTDYVQEKVFAIDFDEKAVRVGRTLNLIAGDGQTNVLHLNTLDYERWDEKTKDEDWLSVYGPGWNKLRKLRISKDSNRDFGFDVLMANPPFAGEVTQRHIIPKYEICRKPDGKYPERIGRDILFIERNLNFLKPGGRMAVVLPQGRFNNSSDKQIREFIAGHCRILAVVGLHGNVFKPHTGTKTSVLFVQKWHDTLCPKADDYPIFFATMQEPSKDNSGDKIYVKQADGSPLLDTHEHLIVKHDLFNHDGLTQDGIAEAFIEFAKKERLSFFDLDLPGFKNLAGLYADAFDEVKYRVMLEEQEISEVMLSDAQRHNSVLRFDAQYFQKKYLKEDESIAKYPNRFLGDIAFITDGQHGYHEVDEFSDIRHITAKNAKGWFVNDEGADRIAKWVDDKNKRSSLQLNDVILSTRGTVGLCAIVDNDILPANIDQDVARINIDENVCKATVLIAYLNSVIGQDWIVRNSTGMVQQGLALWRLKELPVPIFTTEFQIEIDATIQDARLKRISSRDIYNQAENLLLNSLGMADFSPSTKNTAQKSFKNSFLASGRLDAEYYQPKYEETEQLCFENAEYTKRVKDIQIHNGRGLQPDYVENGGLNVINSRHILERELDYKNFEQTHSGSWDTQVKARIYRNDILTYTTGANIGRTQVYLSDEKALASNHVNILRIENENPVYVAFVLNSKIGRLQTEQLSAGSAQQELYPKDIESFYIPFINKDAKTQIADLVQQSFTLKAESERLLAAAKRAVELAIETDEPTAMAYLNDQTGVQT